MLKKIFCLALASFMTFSAAGCRPEPVAPVSPPVDTVNTNADPETPDAPPVGSDWKIGIMTGTVSQNEEEFQAAQRMLREHGSDRIITTTYPDRFNDEIETTINNVVGLADAGVNAIIINQAVPGTLAAIQRVRETHPDMLFIAGTIMEPPREMAAAADINMNSDEISMGTAIIEQAARQGAHTFVHYSFPRHLGIETIARRRQIFMETADRLGLDWVEVTAPDPTGDAGTAGAQQFILEDVPRQVERYGKDIALFSTNCSMQEPLIRSVLEQQAIFPQQCDASPFHGYPAALNIPVEEGREGDALYMIEQIKLRVAEGGNSGRMSTWGIPVAMLSIEAATDYAIKFAEGNTNGRFDPDAIRASIAKVAQDYGSEVHVSVYEDDRGQVENFLMLLCDFVDF